MSRITQDKKLKKMKSKGLKPLKWYFFKKQEKSLNNFFSKDTTIKLLNQLEEIGLQGLFQNSFRFYEEGSILQKKEFEKIEESSSDRLFCQRFEIDGKIIIVAYNYED